ncbi:MAG: hypothetical protein VX028_00755 [Nanoarchaeota archaeon]|nr:hypothetical protein [Nanoarchaeota archaeon]
MEQKDINHFEKNFDYGSILPLLLFIVSLYTLYLFLNGFYSAGFISIIISFVIYVANNIILNIKGFSTVFNEYLEDSAAFMAFTVTTLVFGMLYFPEDEIILGVVIFYGICQILAMSRNWIASTKNSQGWPIALNGIFFPFIYYLYVFYFRGFGEAIFIVYFIIVAMLSISNHNFLGYMESKEQVEVVSFKELKKREEIKKKKKDIKIP